ncbi:MAG: cation:proton antiporter [Kiloniellales bacterium]|jgi:CPA2 family monovalent cation:H+ antiporter-2
MGEIPEYGYLQEVIVVLIAAVFSVALFQRFGLGAVLGYLVAGAVIGPSGLALVTDLGTINALGELGVVFLLFTIGLELPFDRIRVMQARTFALGAAQVLVTGIAICGIALLMGVRPLTAIVIGGGLALSSTAIVIRLLVDRGELTSRFGRTCFAILIVQDLMVALFLVLVLALSEDDVSLGFALGGAVLKAVVAVMAILGIGRIVMRHIFMQVAAVRDPDVFVAMSLVVVLAIGLMTQMAGLSMAFGAFLAGMLLAETHYRHQVAADIQPFRGLLLGLFFMSVGMSVDFELTVDKAGLIALFAVGLVILKAGLLAGLAVALGVRLAQAVHLGILLSQGGEFAFVLLAAAFTAGVILEVERELLVVVVAITMMATPLLAMLGRVVERRIERRTVAEIESSADEAEALSDHVVIAGFGRVGTAVAGQLKKSGTEYIAVDLDPHRITEARGRGLPVFYGDATRPEILEAVHVERARAFVVALDEPATALRLVSMVRYIFPDLRVYARARDDRHATELARAGAHIVVPELVATGVKLAGSIVERGDPLAPESEEGEPGPSA